jgi:hypothetical protein
MTTSGSLDQVGAVAAARRRHSTLLKEKGR